MPRVVKFIETKCRRGWLGAGVGKKGELSFIEYRISVLLVEKSFGNGW